MSEMTETTNHVGLAADIVSAYVSNNSVRPNELPDLIASIHGTLAKLANGTNQQPAEELKPPVPIKKSITPDFIISLEDGKPYKTLKRHLRRAHNISPEGYRAKWGLPSDYPPARPVLQQ